MGEGSGQREGKSVSIELSDYVWSLLGALALYSPSYSRSIHTNHNFDNLAYQGSGEDILSHRCDYSGAFECYDESYRFD